MFVISWVCFCSFGFVFAVVVVTVVTVVTVGGLVFLLQFCVLFVGFSCVYGRLRKARMYFLGMLLLLMLLLSLA